VRVTVRIPGPLRPYARDERSVEVDRGPGHVGGVLERLFDRHPALRDRVLTEQGELRPHVNVFVGSESIRHAGGLHTSVPEGAEITILPAVSGG